MAYFLHIFNPATITNISSGISETSLWVTPVKIRSFSSLIEWEDMLSFWQRACVSNISIEQVLTKTNLGPGKKKTPE